MHHIWQFILTVLRLGEFGAGGTDILTSLILFTAAGAIYYSIRVVKQINAWWQYRRRLNHWRNHVPKQVPRNGEVKS